MSTPIVDEDTKAFYSNWNNISGVSCMVCNCSWWFIPLCSTATALVILSLFLIPIVVLTGGIGAIVIPFVVPILLILPLIWVCCCMFCYSALCLALFIHPVTKAALKFHATRKDLEDRIQKIKQSKITPAVAFESYHNEILHDVTFRKVRLEGSVSLGVKVVDKSKEFKYESSDSGYTFYKVTQKFNMSKEVQKLVDLEELLISRLIDNVDVCYKVGVRDEVKEHSFDMQVSDSLFRFPIVECAVMLTLAFSGFLYFYKFITSLGENKGDTKTYEFEYYLDATPQDAFDEFNQRKPQIIQLINKLKSIINPGLIKDAELTLLELQDHLSLAAQMQTQQVVLTQMQNQSLITQMQNQQALMLELQNSKLRLELAQQQAALEELSKRQNTPLPPTQPSFSAPQFPMPPIHLPYPSQQPISPRDIEIMAPSAPPMTQSIFMKQFNHSHPEEPDESDEITPTSQ